MRRSLIVFVLALLLLSTSGCASLGYLPGYVKQADYNQEPTLEEVRATAAQIRDGWDTRATFNRYAGYYGAVVAAAAVGALAGLAAFDPGSSAIKGIPIGAGFLGAVAGVFNNEPKAQIYSRGARYVTGLLNLSNKRLPMRKYAQGDPRAYLDNLKDEAEAAKTKLVDLAKEQTARMDAAAVATTRASSETDQTKQKHLYAVAFAAIKRVQELDDEVKTTSSARDAVARRVRAVEKRSKESPNETPEQAEARCLLDDLNALLATVSELKEASDPQNIAKLLSSVGASSKKTDTATDTGKATAAKSEEKKPSGPTLGDLELPAKSTCDDAI